MNEYRNTDPSKQVINTDPDLNRMLNVRLLKFSDDGFMSVVFTFYSRENGDLPEEIIVATVVFLFTVLLLKFQNNLATSTKLQFLNCFGCQEYFIPALPVWLKNP